VILGVRDRYQGKKRNHNVLQTSQLHRTSDLLFGELYNPEKKGTIPVPERVMIELVLLLNRKKQVPDELIQVFALVVVIAVGVGFIYLISRVQRMYEAQRSAFSRGIATAQKIQNVEAEFITLLQRVESDSAALQKIALQIELSVASLNNGVTASLQGASERYSGAIEELRDHLDLQEERLLKLVEQISQMAETTPQERLMKVQTSLVNGNGKANENGAVNSVRLRREIVSRDPATRFAVLQEWVATNKLAILHRASKGLVTPAELMASIPRYFEAEGEITSDRTLLIRTRGYPEKLAIPLDDADPSGNEVLSRRTHV